MPILHPNTQHTKKLNVKIRWEEHRHVHAAKKLWSIHNRQKRARAQQSHHGIDMQPIGTGSHHALAIGTEGTEIGCQYRRADNRSRLRHDLGQTDAIIAMRPSRCADLKVGYRYSKDEHVKQRSHTELPPKSLGF
jgi:hypothetical protein